LRDYAEAWGLISYGVDFLDLFRRAATYMDKILKGAKRGDLPVEQPTKFELVINLKTVRALGLTIPPSMLGRADEVVELNPIAQNNIVKLRCLNQAGEAGPPLHASHSRIRARVECGCP